MLVSHHQAIPQSAYSLLSAVVRRTIQTSYIPVKWAHCIPQFLILLYFLYIHTSRIFGSCYKRVAAIRYYISFISQGGQDVDVVFPDGPLS